MKLKNCFTLLAFLLVLTGCASFEKPTSLADRILYAEGQYHGVIDAVDSSLNAGTISSVTAADITAKADDMNLALIAAKTALAEGDPTTANGQLVLALTALQSLQEYLRAQGAKK